MNSLGSQIVRLPKKYMILLETTHEGTKEVKRDKLNTLYECLECYGEK